MRLSERGAGIAWLCLCAWRSCGRRGARPPYSGRDIPRQGTPRDGHLVWRVSAPEHIGWRVAPAMRLLPVLTDPLALTQQLVVDPLVVIAAAAPAVETVVV